MIQFFIFSVIVIPNNKSVLTNFEKIEKPTTDFLDKFGFKKIQDNINLYYRKFFSSVDFIIFDINQIDDNINIIISNLPHIDIKNLKHIKQEYYNHLMNFCIIDKDNYLKYLEELI